MPTSQISATQAPMPNLFVGACSMTTSAAAPDASASPGAAASGLSESSCTADPRIEEGVEDVDGEVHQDVADRDHCDEALDLLVLTLGDRTEQFGAHPRDLEHDLDDHRAADQ